MSNVGKKRAERGGHRAHVTKSLARTKLLVEDLSAENILELKQLKLSLVEKKETIKGLDKAILELIEKEEDIEDEIATSSSIVDEIHAGLASIEEALKAIELRSQTRLMPQRETSWTSQPTDSRSSARVKLPKLEVRKFSGKIKEWPEFWDSFNSAIHENKSLSDVDKFTYLRGLLEEPAKSAIGGFALTSRNYSAAVKVLERRFGNKTVVQRAYINELLNLKPVFNENDTGRLRKFFDALETNYRGLEALGVNENCYSEIVVPSILTKLPEAVRLTITRNKEYMEWEMEDVVNALMAEIELRECHGLTNQRNEHISGEYTSRRRHQPGTSSTFLTKRQELFCAFCTGNHRSEDCKRITNRKERMELLRRFNRCYKCINKGHIAKNCRARNNNCNACGGSHHVSICEGKCESRELKKEENASSVSLHEQEEKSESSSNLHVGTSCRVALQTAQGILKGAKEKRVRVLFDSGSQKSFVTSQAKNDAKLHVVRKDWLAINTFGGATDKGMLREVVELEIVSIGGNRKLRMEALVVPQISQVRNEHLEVVKGQYPHLRKLWLSDVCKTSGMLEIDVMVGADNLWAFQSGEVVKGGDDEPVAVDTCLGWVVSGPLKESTGSEFANVSFVSQTGNQNEFVNVNVVSQVSNQNELDSIRANVNKLWDLETLGVMESNDIHEALLDKIKFNGSRYSVQLPWKQGHSYLPTNYPNSIARMKGQLKRLASEPNLLSEYDAIIKEQESVGIIERVGELETKEKVHYLPHQAVIRRDAKTTKMRIVYDASSKEGKKGTSLNDCLHVGPSLTPLLFDILLRFRENPIVLIGDIEKAFLNVEVASQDRDYLRFLWAKDAVSGNLDVVVYRFCRVVFGLNASPFLLNATLRHHIEQFKETDPNFVQKLKDGFYVDDLVSGGKTTQEVKDLYEKAKTRMAKGGFTLRKWLTNDAVLREYIGKHESDAKLVKATRLDDHETYAQSSLGISPDSSCDRVLGINWDCEKDVVKFEFLKLLETQQDAEILTKRKLLSMLAKIFDPLGLVSCVIVLMKILFQQLCVENLSWDEELTRQQSKVYLNWIEDLRRVKTITVERCVYRKASDVYTCELHGFGDASVKAYCAVVYFVCRTSTGVYARLIAAKTRVAPLKTLTIPRLELMSALMLAKLVDSVKKALATQVTFTEIRYWLDSITALYWIQNRGEWKQFVRHRVNQILKLTNKGNWSHCPGLENPADLGSRGVMASKLRENPIWWTGPEWLSNVEKAWPARVEIVATKESKAEEREANVLIANVKEVEGVDKVIDIEKYSQLEKLVRVTARVSRFGKNLTAKKEGKHGIINSGYLKRQELSEAEKLWIEASQRQLREKENYAQLESQLNLVEEDRVLKCRGRFAESDLSEDAKYPILLPREGRLTELIILYCHNKVHHGGVRETLAEVRSRYWIPKGRQRVKGILNKCTVCKKLEGKPYNTPKEANLPEFRVREAEPFTKTGVDFAGPLFVKNRTNETDKVYIALFSCCVSRALHLDLVRDLTAEEFLRCLRRFSARRGTPALIVSDNAKTFKAAAKAVAKLYRCETLQGYLEVNRIEWRFNLERAPWWGGFFERMVQSVKRCLRKVLGDARLTFDELLTTLVEVEGTLNSRPLTYIYDEVGSEPLTPSHLMVGRRLKSMPDGVVNDVSDEAYCSRRFQYLSQKKEHFWNRWRREYLTDLREFHRGSREDDKRVVQRGDVVIVHEENVKRGNWKTAVVEELITGRDGVVRGAKVRLIRKGKEVRLSRPVQKLYPTEINHAEERRMERENVESVSHKENEGNVGSERGRVGMRRAAALDAMWKTRNMID